MTCDRCKNVPDEVIDNYIKEKVAELKKQLKELEQKPKIVVRNKSFCGEWLGKYPHCCMAHSDAYYNTAG